MAYGYPELDSGIQDANAAQRSLFASRPVVPDYGQVQTTGESLPVANRVAQNVSGMTPRVTGMPGRVDLSLGNAALRAREAINTVVPNRTATIGPQPAMDAMARTNALMRARYAANPVVPNTSAPAFNLTALMDHIGSMFGLGK
jgi:hypothetical protein